MARELSEDLKAQDREAPHGQTVYRAIYREGMEELSRASANLAWSGLAAGLSMGVSLLGESLLRSHLPDAPWRPLVAKLGYSLGFLLVILGRQQLFTENTLTVILPLLRVKTTGVLRNVARLWSVVFAANIAGTALFAAAVTLLPVLEPSVKEAMTAAGYEALAPGPWSIMLRGVFAGWLIALMVWLMPYAETGRVSVILLVTYIVGLAAFSHVVAGTVDVFTLSARGLVSWPLAFVSFTLPALVGNTVGGVALVAALGHAQFVEGEDAPL